MGTEATTDEDVIALDYVAVVGNLYLASQKPDFADEMLGAGVMATSKVDVDRRVEGDPGFAAPRNFLGVAFGVGGGELASRVAGAGNQTGADRVGRNRQPQSLDPFPGSIEIRRCDARDEQVLPDCEAEVAITELAGDSGQAPHLRDRHPPDRDNDPDPAELVLFLRMNANVRQALERRPRQQGAWYGAVQPAAQFLFDKAKEFIDAELVEHVFQSCFGAVGAISMVDEHAHDRVGDLGGVGGFHHDAGVAGKT